MLNVLRENRTKQRFELHEFVILRDHVHLILKPPSLVPLEKAIQFIKGGFSFRAKKEMHFNDEIWQKGYNEQRITHAHDYAEKATYIQLDPVKAGYVDHPEQFQYSSARLKSEIDPPPAHFKSTLAVSLQICISVGAPCFNRESWTSVQRKSA